MGKKDPRVDAYIAKAADFARPILQRLRKVIHAGCPEVEETIKWGFPHFTHHGILCAMAAFKQHCAFGFWHKGLRGALEDLGITEQAFGPYGRLTSVADLPQDALLKQLVAKAAKLNENGPIPKPAARPKSKTPLKVPADLQAALKRNARARDTFDNFSPSRRKAYVQWITEARREETRKKRLKTALEWLAEGKAWNWKYER